MLPRKAPDVQDADKSSEPVRTGLHIETQVGKDRHKTLILKTSPVCSHNNKSGLEVKLNNVCINKNNKTVQNI